jgi:hypothetical protein
MNDADFWIIAVLLLWIIYGTREIREKLDNLEKAVEELREAIPPDPTREEARRAAASRDARMAAERAAAERNEHNREAKRRLKVRKAAAIEKHRQEQIQVTLRAVAKSLEYEQRLRNQTAVEYGWPIHPNDVEGLTPEQQATMLEAWRERQPPPEFLTGGVS